MSYYPTVDLLSYLLLLVIIAPHRFLDITSLFDPTLHVFHVKKKKQPLPWAF